MAPPRAALLVLLLSSLGCGDPTAHGTRPDGGPTEHDGGGRVDDAGPAAGDSGTPMDDSGVPVGDSGPGAPDAARVSADSGVSVELPAPNIFSDDFESGDLSSTNAEGFRWTSDVETSVVNGEAVVWNGEDVHIPIADGKDWTAIEGTHSLRFRYPANEPWAEQRFDLGAPHPDLWVRFWVRVPLNYVHGAEDTPRNQKFLSIWMDGYSSRGDGSTVWLGFWPTGADGTDSNLAVTYSAGGYTASRAYQQYQPFITSSRDRGRWMQIVFHTRAQSAPGVADGVMETWRRWEDEESFTKLHEVLDAEIRIATGGPAGFQRGYLMGWANGHYAEETEFLLDLFEVSDAPLVPGY